MISSSEFIRGYSEILVLSILNKKDSYVYELVQNISDYSKGQIIITNPSMLFIVRKLYDDGKLSSYDKANERGVLRKYYRITTEGKKYYDNYKQDYLESLKSMQKILLEEFLLWKNGSINVC